MIIDSRLLFCEDQAARTDGQFGDIIDVRPSRDMFAGAAPLHWVIQVAEAYAGGNFVRFSVRGAPAVSGNTLSGTAADIASTGLIATARLGAGGIFAVSMPQTGLEELGPGSRDLNYLRLMVDVTGSFTAGSITSWLGLTAPKHAVYMDAVN